MYDDTRYYINRKEQMYVDAKAVGGLFERVETVEAWDRLWEKFGEFMDERWSRQDVTKSDKEGDIGDAENVTLLYLKECFGETEFTEDDG